MKYIIDIPESIVREYGECECILRVENKNKNIINFVPSKIKAVRYEPSAEANQAWEFANKIRNIPFNVGGMSILEMRECFGCHYINDIFEMPYSEAKEKYDTWKKQKEKNEVKVGDEVVCGGTTGIITFIDDDRNCYQVITNNGSVEFLYAGTTVKTGRHFPEIVKIFKRIGENIK